jgi:hypothetical protein
MNLCKNYIISDRASFIVKKPSLNNIKDDSGQNEESNDSQKNENSSSHNLEIIDYPYYLNYREKEAFPLNTEKLSFQNYREFDDIAEDFLSRHLIKDIIKKKSDKKKSLAKDINSSFSFKKTNQTSFRKIINNKKIINKNNSPINKNNNNFEKILYNKLSKKTNSKNNKTFKSKIEKIKQTRINCPSPDSDKCFLINQIHKFNSQISSNKTRKKINIINNSNSNQKLEKIKLKITSNFADFTKNKRKEKKDKNEQKEINLNFEKISKNKNRTYNTLTISNKERIFLKLKKIDKINNNDESNRSQKVKFSKERKIINNDEFKNKRILNIMPILKTEKSSDCLGRNKSKQHILYVNHYKYHKINKTNFNNNYKTINIINSQRNKKNNTVLNHILKIQNNNYSSKTYVNPFDKKEKKVVKHLKNLNSNKAKKH